MTSREDRLHAEVSALWRELYGDQQPVAADAGQTLDLVLKGLPEVAYERLSSPYLQGAAFTWARQP